MHTLKVAVVAPGGPLSFDAIRASFARYLTALPAFRQRIVEVPAGLGHPVWIDDADFDLDNHLLRARLPAPGGHRELDELVARVAETRLDRSRPLWEVTVVEGLAGGRIAFVAKLHHSIADGVTTLSFLRQVVAGMPEAEQPWRGEPEPGVASLLQLALRGALRRLASLPLLLWHSIRGAVAMLMTARHSRVQPPLPFEAPVAPMNHPLTPGRRFATTTLPMPEVIRLKRHFGVTVNDMVLALCAGALRRHLLETGALPERPLLVGVPVDTRVGHRPMPGANHVGQIFGTLATDVADPVERLHAIAAVMTAAKARQAALGRDLMERWAEFTPPRLYCAIVRAWSRWRMPEHVPPPFNVVVSNVPGPRDPIRFGTAKLESLHSVGPILNGIGLNITAWSYGDQLAFGLLTGESGIEDPVRLLAHLSTELEALSRAAAAGEEQAPVEPSPQVEAGASAP